MKNTSNHLKSFSYSEFVGRGMFIEHCSTDQDFRRKNEQED